MNRMKRTNADDDDDDDLLLLLRKKINTLINGNLEGGTDNSNAGCNAHAMNRRLGLKSVSTIPFCLIYLSSSCVL